MRLRVFSVLLICLLWAFPLTAAAMEAPSLDGEPEFNETVEKLAEGNMKLNPAEILSMLGEDLTREFKECASSVIVILVTAAISGLAGVMTDSLSSKSAGEASFFACFTLMSAGAVNCFTSALGYGSDVIGAMTDFITKLSPLLMVMLVTCGDPIAAGAFHPVLSAAVYVISIIVEKCILPLICFSAVLAVAGNISGKARISGFCKVIKSVQKWVMAAVITIFTGISAIYGFTTPALDAVSGKAIKFAVGSLVPVVGSFLSDTLETVISGARLMKNAVGTAGIVIMCMICLAPVLKIGAMQLMLRLTAAVAEPLADKRVSSMLWEISEAVTMIFGTVIMVAVLFMINLSIILAATNF